MHKSVLWVIASLLYINAQPADTVQTAKSGPGVVRLVKEEKPAMEIGGYVTVDYYSLTDSLKKATLSLGRVELGANVNISEQVLASVVILAQNKLDSLSLY